MLIAVLGILLSSLGAQGLESELAACCSGQGGPVRCDRSVGKLLCRDGKFAFDCICSKHNPYFDLKKYGKRMPENARHNSEGDGWVCSAGYLQKGRSCKEVDVPSNAVTFPNGVGWKCRQGYLQKRRSCKKLIIPKNAVLNERGTNWKCKEGFQQYRAKCRPISLPENAVLDSSGNHWRCVKGFVRRRNKCIPTAN